MGTRIIFLIKAKALVDRCSLSAKATVDNRNSNHVWDIIEQLWRHLRERSRNHVRTTFRTCLRCCQPEAWDKTHRCFNHRVSDDPHLILRQSFLNFIHMEERGLLKSERNPVRSISSLDSLTGLQVVQVGSRVQPS